MATFIRGSHQVDAALKKVTKRFEAAQKKINSSAAKRMKMGQYEAATKWMEVGQAFEVFSSKIEIIKEEWRGPVVSSQKTPEGVESRKSRPQSEDPKKSRRAKSRISAKDLSVPALKALMKRGGTASLDEMLGDLHNHVLSEFPESDLVVNVPFNFPPWQKAVRKTQKYFQSQGWIDRRKDGQWRITEKGRSAGVD